MTFFTLSNDTITLVPIDETYTTEIFNYNQGNVKDNFAKFSNLKDVKEWLHATLTLVNYGTKIETVILSNTKEFLGMIALDNLDTDLVELRLWITQESQKKGIATLASYLMLDYFNSTYPDKQLRYVSKTDNVPSMALAKKLNLTLVRTYKDDSNKSFTVFVLKATNI
jgi:RimJ/RimL family protein N-acetyltransferase